MRVDEGQGLANCWHRGTDRRASYHIPDFPDCLSIQRSLRRPPHFRRGPLKFRKSAESCGFLEVSLVLGFFLIPNGHPIKKFFFLYSPLHPTSNLCPPPQPAQPTPSSSHPSIPPLLFPVYLGYLFYFPFPGTSMHPTLGPPRHLASLGLPFEGWLFYKLYC